MGEQKPKEKLLLGIDIGTGSSKGVLTTSRGEVLAQSEQPHDLSLPRAEWAEHDAEAVWWNDFATICHASPSRGR